jgi:DNA-directed RNA polymerase beta' subunit
MIMNNMSLDTIITKLRLTFPKIFFVYTPANADVSIIRCYISHSMIKIPAAGFSESIIVGFIDIINNTLIRGIDGIMYTEIASVVHSEVQPDGSIKSDKIYAIETIGSNLEDVLDNPFIDKYRTQTDSIQDIYDMFGIEAARLKIINEIRKTMPDVLVEHCSVFASEMTTSGEVTGIQKTGLQARESNNVTLRLSFQSPIQVIEHAATNHITDHITGISGHLVAGATADFGTTYNGVCINEDFIMNYINNINKKIDDEL